MSKNYDNWERIVAAVLKKEQLWQLFHEQSRSPSISSESSSGFSFSFCHLDENDVPFTFSSSPKWSDSNQKEDDFVSEKAASTSSSILVEDHVTSSTTRPRKRDLKIQVPKLEIFHQGGFNTTRESCGYRPCTSPRSKSPIPSSRVHRRSGGRPTESSQNNWPDDAKHQSYPLPLPPGATSNSPPFSRPNSGAASPSTPLRSPDIAENLKSPGTRWEKGKLMPLPPGATSNSPPFSRPNSGAASPSTPLRSPDRAENLKSPGTRWKKGTLIGRGPLGHVYLGFNSENGELCAMKEITLFFGDAKSRARMLETEIALLSTLKHPNIVQYYGTETVGDNLYIYFEYVSGGSIYTILQDYGKLGEPAIRSYTQQILMGLAYLHSKRIVHRDVKGASILVDPNGSLKLSNFGIGKQITGQYSSSLLTDSVYWTAPEALMNPNVRNLATDIWSLGCTIIEMALSKPPISQYNTAVAMFKIANHKELPAIPDHLSNEGKDFVMQCLQWDPQRRATASQLLEHPFVKILSPSGKQVVLSSTSSHHPAVTNAVKSEGTDYARIRHQFDPNHSSGASKSNFQLSDIYTQRNTSTPVSPVGSPLPHPRSPQLLNQRTSPPPKSSAYHHLNQSILPKESFHNLPKHSPSPSYWDPNILRGVHSDRDLASSDKDSLRTQFGRTSANERLNEQLLLADRVFQQLHRAPLKLKTSLDWNPSSPLTNHRTGGV